jgi:hypothetical protein
MTNKTEISSGRKPGRNLRFLITVLGRCYHFVFLRATRMTITLIVFFLPFGSRIVIFVVPFFFALTFPFLLTDAIRLFLL